MNSLPYLRKLWDFAASRNLSVFVLVTSIVYVLVLFSFGLLVDLQWLEVIAGLAPYKVLYALFFLNLLLWEIRWIPAVLKRCKEEALPQVLERLQAGRQRTAAAVQPDSRAFRQQLERRGYEVRIADGMLYACKGRFSPIGNVLFHTSFVVLLFGVLAGSLYGFHGTAVVTEGQPFKGTRADYKSVAAGPAASLPAVDFDLEKVSADFWQGRMFFTRLEARLLHRGGRDVVRVSSAARVGEADVTLSGYGYAPMYVLKDAAGETTARGFVSLNILSRGSEDDFAVPGYPHRIVVSFYPDHAAADGRAMSRSMDPVDPAYALRIFRGRIPVYRGVVKAGEWAEYDGMSISFPTFARYGEFRIVNHPGHPLIWSAFVLMALGLLWRLVFYRREVLLWSDGARTWLAARADHYPKLHAHSLDRLVEEAGRKSG